MKAPTITKVEEIATVIGVHPLSLIAYAYLPSDSAERDQFWARIAAELESFDNGVARVAAARHAEDLSNQLLDAATYPRVTG